MTTTTPTHPDPRPTRRGGPPLALPALAWAALTIAAVPTFPAVRPGQDPADVLRGLQASDTASLSAVLLVASVAPLLVWTAATHHRLRETLHLRAVGPTIGLVGGVLAAVAVVVSGVCGWAAADSSSLGDAVVVRVLTALGFAAGGPVFALGLGLAIAGVAVTSLMAGLLPRVVAVLGLVLAGLGAVGVLALLVPALSPVLPIVRFGGLIWIVAMSLLLPSGRVRSSR